MNGSTRGCFPAISRSGWTPRIFECLNVYTASIFRANLAAKAGQEREQWRHLEKELTEKEL